MTAIEKYKKFLDEIGWDEFNNVEKEYFFDELHSEPNENGIVLRVVLNKDKKNSLIITHVGTGAHIDISQREIKTFRKWLENNYAYGEDGSSYFACKEANEKDNEYKYNPQVVYDYDLEQKVLSLLFKYYSPRDISRGIPFISKKGMYKADFVVYGTNGDVKLIIEVKRRESCTPDIFSKISDRLQAVNESVIFILTDGDVALYSKIGEKYKVYKLNYLLTELTQSKKVEKAATISAIRSHLIGAIISAKDSFVSNVTFDKEKKEKERKLKKFIKDILASDIHQDEKESSTWCFNTEKEREFFQILLGEYKGDYILKFSSLRGLLTLIDNESIGMCSLVCMNDPGEKDYADNKVNKRDNEDNSIDTFIISGCKDDAEKNLTMWRLYGGDAKGICLKFRIDKTKLNKHGFYLAPVSYADSNKKHYELEIIKNICTQPKDKKWNFDFAEWNIWKHFFKDNAYAVEEEIRLLFMPTPHIPLAKSIWFIDDRTNIYSEMQVFDLSKETVFPLILNRVVLGANFPAYDENTDQLNRRFKRSNIRTYEVERHKLVSHCDDIQNYRS